MGAAVRPAIALLIVFMSLVLMGLGLAELIRLTLSASDLALERHLAASPGLLITPMQVFTYLGSGAIVLPVAAIAAAVCIRSSRQRDALMLVVVSGGALLLYTAIKDVVDRPRPPVVHLANVSGASFPSGHSVQAAAIYGAVAYLLARRRPQMKALFTWTGSSLLTVMIGWSRLFLGVHYPSDVVGGLLLGALWTGATVAIFSGAGGRSNQGQANPPAAGSGIERPVGHEESA